MSPLQSVYINWTAFLHNLFKCTAAINGWKDTMQLIQQWTQQWRYFTIWVLDFTFHFIVYVLLLVVLISLFLL